MPSNLLVTLCTYNEAENIAALVKEIHQVADDVDVLIIDDNSPDGTGAVADRLCQNDQRVHVLHRPGKQGLGAATIAGFQWGLERDYEFLLNMDADFSHHPRHLPFIRTHMESADVVIGSRYISGGGIEGWQLKRHIMSRGINTYARCTLGLRTRDNSGSYRCYRRSILSRIDWSECRAMGYAFQEELLYLCQRLGARIVEIPIVFEDRQVGRSKINNREIVSALWVMARMGVERLCGVAPPAIRAALADIPENDESAIVSDLHQDT